MLCCPGVGWETVLSEPRWAVGRVWRRHPDGGLQAEHPSLPPHPPSISPLLSPGSPGFCPGDPLRILRA